MCPTFAEYIKFWYLPVPASLSPGVCIYKDQPGTVMHRQERSIEFNIKHRFVDNPSAAWRWVALMRTWIAFNVVWWPWGSSATVFHSEEEEGDDGGWSNVDVVIVVVVVGGEGRRSEDIRKTCAPAVVHFIDTSPYISRKRAFNSVVLPALTWPINATRISNSQIVMESSVGIYRSARRARALANSYSMYMSTRGYSIINLGEPSECAILLPQDTTYSTNITTMWNALSIFLGSRCGCHVMISSKRSFGIKILFVSHFFFSTMPPGIPEFIL